MLEKCLLFVMLEKCLFYDTWKMLVLWNMKKAWFMMIEKCIHPKDLLKPDFSSSVGVMTQKNIVKLAPAHICANL